ncbi:MAG: hypothetical protein GY943_08645 [Chloroflexi bacterium]|nr:hypothetical protein [Chloroflexota bacterium]
MSENGSWRNWAIVFVLMIVFAVATALWSSLTPSISLFGGNTVEIPDVPVEVVPIELDIPAIGSLDGQFLELSPFVAIGILAGVVIGLVVLVGAGIALINTVLVRQTTAVTSDATYQEHQSTLAQREKDRLKQMKVGRAAGPIPDHNRPRWSAISTSLLILMFVAFFGMIINFTFIPSGELLPKNSDGVVVEAVSSASRVVGGMLAVTLAALLVVFRPKRGEPTEKTEEKDGIPWDSIAVLITGLLIVGIGVGAMVYLGL